MNSATSAAVADRFAIVDTVVVEMLRQFLDSYVCKVAKSTDVVMTMNDANGAIEEILTLYGDILQLNPALLKSEIYIVQSSVEGLECFNQSNSERFSLPATVAEVAEKRNVGGMEKKYQQ